MAKNERPYSIISSLKAVVVSILYIYNCIASMHIQCLSSRIAIVLPLPLSFAMTDVNLNY